MDGEAAEPGLRLVIDSIVCASAEIYGGDGYGLDLFDSGHVGLSTNQRREN